MMGATDFTQMLPEDFDRLNDEELAQACTRGSGYPKSEAFAMETLRNRFGLRVHDHRDACADLWRDQKTAAEILDAVRDMAALQARTPKLLLEAHGPDGHIWRFYADGRTEGFPRGTVIVNHAIRHLAVLQSQLHAATAADHERMDAIHRSGS